MESDNQNTSTGAPTPEAQAATNVDLIRRYLAVATPGSLDLEAIRPFLADDVTIDDTLMPISGADAFIDALRQTPEGGGMSATVETVIADDSTAAARVLFAMPGMEVRFAQWFWIDDGKINRIEVTYDPRKFLAAAG